MSIGAFFSISQVYITREVARGITRLRWYFCGMTQELFFILVVVLLVILIARR